MTAIFPWERFCGSGRNFSQVLFVNLNMRFTEHPPRTIMELYKMLPAGTLAEVINGSIYMSPAPTPKHQRIVGKLYRLLTDYVEKENIGEALIAPCDVFLDEAANAVQPDLIILLKENASLVGDDAIHGAPDILLEVLSEGNRDHDLIRKKELYQRFGIKEYWVINPDTKETFGFILNQGRYTNTATMIGKIKSPLLNQEFTF